MKLIISTIVYLVIGFLLGWLFYGIIFLGFMDKMGYAALMRGHASIWWAMIIGYLIQGFFFAYIYDKYFRGNSPVLNGLKYAFLLSLLIYLPMVLFIWASYNVKYPGAIVDGLILTVITFVNAIVIALIYGKKEKQEETTQT